jgi:uncharacterized damage-inducible protein DinB
MRINELLLSEFDQEMKKTRKLLERVPSGKADWKPHEKSMTLARLAGHIAELPSWAGRILNSESLDLTPAMSGGYKPYMSDSAEELQITFDKWTAEAREALAKAGEKDLEATWSLQLHGRTLFSMSRFEVIRNMFINHLIHHRAQLGVYLRLNDIPLPEMYGPSADEGGGMFNAKE